MIIECHNIHVADGARETLRERSAHFTAMGHVCLSGTVCVRAHRHPPQRNNCNDPLRSPYGVFFATSPTSTGTNYRTMDPGEALCELLTLARPGGSARTQSAR
jgi:hypothetical protein